MQPEATPFTQKHGLQPLSAVNGMPDRAHYSCMNGSSPEKDARAETARDIDRHRAARRRLGMTDSAATGAEYSYDDAEVGIEPDGGTTTGGSGDAGTGSGAEVPETPETVEHIADEVRDEIRLGHVEDDVSHVLEERLGKAGIEMRPEDVDDLAEEIERDAST